MPALGHALKNARIQNLAQQLHVGSLQCIRPARGTDALQYLAIEQGPRRGPSPVDQKFHRSALARGLDVLSASPEAFLIRRAGRIESRPIKGTATTMSSMLAKDYAENVMIADLVRTTCQPYAAPAP